MTFNACISMQQRWLVLAVALACSLPPLQTALAFATHPNANSISSCSALGPWRPSRSVAGTNLSAEAATAQTANGAAPHLKTTDILSLPSIRSTLIRQEETIIFALIERSQFRQNAEVYEKGAALSAGLGAPVGSTVPSEEEKLSFLEYMLVGTEVLHAGVRRYTSPEEHAFFPSRLPQGMILNPLDYPDDLLSSTGGAAEVNFNEILLKKYIDVVVPSIAGEGDDEQYGSTVLADIAVLQALSKRVHYGKFVAESKYRSDPEGYQKLVDDNDAEGVMELLTNAKVEEQVLRRARLKAATYGREPMLSSLPPIDGDGEVGGGGSTADESTAFVAAAAASAVVAAVEAMKADEGGDDNKGRSTKVDPRVIESIYRNIIIPLTKDIEVAYLFRRCGRDPPPEYAPDRMSVDCR
jgi:chorismate mutase